MSTLFSSHVSLCKALEGSPSLAVGAQVVNSDSCLFPQAVFVLFDWSWVLSRRGKLDKLDNTDLNKVAHEYRVLCQIELVSVCQTMTLGSFLPEKSMLNCSLLLIKAGQGFAIAL
jgi:hypothetical protein